MNPTAARVSTSRWNRLKTRVAHEGMSGLLTWAKHWLYWNARLYVLAHPPSWQQLRAAYKYRRQKKKYGIQNPILVYSMGKVASTSVYASLRALDLDVPVHHMVFLNDLDKRETWLRQAKTVEPLALQTLARVGRIRREIDAHPNQRWNIISLVRAPVPRGISTFFHNLGTTFPAYRERRARNELTAQELGDYFVHQYFDQPAVDWFDREVKAIFGLDVYASEFPKARGYAIYENDRCRLLLIRLEDLERCAAVALREFLNIPDFQLTQSNLGTEKEYGDLYREFQKNLVLTPEWLARWHQSRYAQHFYAPEELEHSVRRWVTDSPVEPAQVHENSSQARTRRR